MRPPHTWNRDPQLEVDCGALDPPTATSEGADGSSCQLLDAGHSDPAEVFNYLRFAHLLDTDVRLREAVADVDLSELRKVIGRVQQQGPDDVAMNARIN